MSPGAVATWLHEFRGSRGKCNTHLSVQMMEYQICSYHDFCAECPFHSVIQYTFMGQCGGCEVEGDMSDDMQSPVLEES